MSVLYAQHNNSQVFIPVVVLAPLVNGTGSYNKFTALIDTGATSTCITPKVAQQLNLSASGRRGVHGVSGLQYHNSYMFEIGFDRPVLRPDGTSYNSIAVMPKLIVGTEFFVNTGFDVLLGMDVLSLGSLKIEGNGTCSFAF